MSNSTVNLPRFPYGSGGRNLILPVDAGTHLYEGTLVSQLDATGMLVPTTTASSGPAIGVACHEQDATSGSDGDLRCAVATDGIFIFACGSSGNAFTEANLIGSPAYASDDHTVTPLRGTGAPVAGLFMGMEPDGRVRVFVSSKRLDFAQKGIENLQVVTGTFAAGTCTVTVGAGQYVTAATKAFPCMSAVVGGTATLGGIAHIIASNVVGGSGVGQLVFKLLDTDGSTSADGTGLFAALLVN